MTPSARVQAAIELLDAIIRAAREGGAAADTLIARYFAERRYAGSKDRRAVRELVYGAVRALGELPASGRAAMLAMIEDGDARADVFTGPPHGPAPVGANEQTAIKGVAPAWLVDRLTTSGLSREEIDALIDRAPLDLRVNRRLTTPDAVIATLGAGEAIAGLPDALRLPAGVDVSALEGQVEVQDAGSQVAAMAAMASPGMSVIDLCAGAGGKTLALAAAMDNQGIILATDTDRARLSNLPPRANRAGVSIVSTRLLDPGKEAGALEDWRGQADVVLIDAPCSGTGTWRRNPEARWRLNPSRLAKLVATQAMLLELGSTLVKPGGALIFIVCSLLDEEGADQIYRFLGARPGWQAATLDLPAGTPHGSGIRLTPLRDSTDGFFVARLQAPC